MPRHAPAADRPKLRDKLVVAITARALFDLEKGHALFEHQGLDAYAEHQRSHEDDILEPGIAFPLVRKLLAMNAGAPADAPAGRSGPAVAQFLRHRPAHLQFDRAFHLRYRRAAFTSGAPTTPYIQPFGAQLFLSANPESVRDALAARRRRGDHPAGQGGHAGA